jgi:2-polyprenyl-3-methyl-5-hydroxy-6-metoxy-1,4-benzoquinol methylase
MIIRTIDLPQFVAESDRLGGPGNPACDQYWAGVEYRPDIVVDQSLDPFGEDYVGQQLALYREMSGRDFDQLSNEHTTLDVAKHVAATNPYDHGSPGGLALHIERLSRAIRLGAPPRGSRFLDMGCGWGLSSEVAAYCGLAVTAVDVNPDFVDLVNGRAARMNLAIAAQQGEFDTFESDDRFAMILFYECFHHALRPWDLLARMARHLEPEGRIVLAGEPINSIWWTHWGLRLDPLSVYCIHKFGWLESGWSAEFLKAAFQRAGLAVQISDHPEGEVGFTVIGSRTKLGRIGASEIGARWQHEGWIVEGGYMTSMGESRLLVPFPEGSTIASLGFQNFRGKPLRVTVSNGEKTLLEGEIPPGRSGIEISAEQARGMLTFSGETWVPNLELGNGDDRQLSMHLEDVTFF